MIISRRLSYYVRGMNSKKVSAIGRLICSVARIEYEPWVEYKGETLDGKAFGEGVQTDRKSTSVGTFRNDKKHGYIIQTLHDG